jgi:Arc/MetJ-type ribon-helix-helix transcriptional regulator
MSYCFPPELGQIVQQELAAGSYHSEDELLLEAVRLLHQREQDLREFKAQLRGRLERLDRGEGIEIEDEEALRAFFDDVQARGQQRYEESRNAP